MGKIKVDKKYFISMLIMIGLPIVFQQVISLALNMIDTFMIGSIGVNELAAVGAANKVYFIFSIICFGVYSGGSIFVSQYWGIKNVEQIRKVVSIDLWIGGILSLVTIALSLLFAPQIITLFSRDPQVIALGASYLRIVCFTYAMIAISFAFSFNSRAVHMVKVPTLISVVAIAINTILNYGLIFGNLGLPKLGVEGAAIATLIARFIEMIIMLLFIYRSYNHPLAAKMKEIMHIDKALFKKVFSTSLPVVGSESAWSIGTTVCFIAYGLLGTSAIAVVQVASVINDMFQCVFFGIGNAAAVIIGNELGRKNTDLAYEYGKYFIILNIGCCVLFTSLLIACKGFIIDIYGYDASTSKLLNDTLLSFALFTTPKMMTYVHICGILRSGGDTKFCMYCDMIGIWLVAIPLAFVGALMGLPLPIVVAMSFGDEIVKCLITLWRFTSKKWIHVLVQKEEIA